jgi:glutathione S-transferase
VPGFHRAFVLRAGGRGTVPCLVLPGTSLDDSQRVLRWLDARTKAAVASPSAAREPALPLLFPARTSGDVVALCQRLDSEFGVAVRTYSYAHVLDTPECAASLVAHAPRWQQNVAAFSWPVMRAIIRNAHGITPVATAAALAAIRAEFAQLSALLASDARPFLCGDVFTAADLVFVSLAAPLLELPYGPEPRAGAGAPAEMRALGEELRATRAGEHALRVWDAERQRVLVDAPGSPCSPAA